MAECLSSMYKTLDSNPSTQHTHIHTDIQRHTYIHTDTCSWSGEEGEREKEVKREKMGERKGREEGARERQREFRHILCSGLNRFGLIDSCV